MIDFMLKDHSRKSPDSIAYRFPRIPILHLHLEFNIRLIEVSSGI